MNKHILTAAISIGLVFSGNVSADDFMALETERARLTEANGECSINGALGADLNACVSAYLCTNYGDCEGQNMRAIEPTPWGVYRDTNEGNGNG